jgi:hypothetical protein
MANVGKYLTISFVILVCLTIFVADLASAQTLSAPHFTVNIIDGSSTTPVTHSTDPYTGEITTQGGNTIQTRNLTFVIDNVPQANYYRIEFKGHYSTNAWTPVYAWGLNVTAVHLQVLKL